MYFTGLADIQLIPSICLTFPEENQLSFLQKGASDLLPVRYSPTRDELLIAPSRDVNPLLAAELIATAAADATAATGGVMGSILQIAEWAVGKSDIEQSNSHSHSQAPPRPHLSHTIKHIRDLYPSFRYTDLAAHPAVILLPYQVFLDCCCCSSCCSTLAAIPIVSSAMIRLPSNGFSGRCPSCCFSSCTPWASPCLLPRPPY